MKNEANEILGIAERFHKGECTRDRALEDIATVLVKNMHSVADSAIRRGEQLSAACERVSNDVEKRLLANTMKGAYDDLVKEIEGIKANIKTRNY